MNPEQMMQMMWGQFAVQVKQLPPEMQQALSNLEVSIVKARDGGELRLVAKEITPGNPYSQRAADALFSQLLVPISNIVGAFQCKVSIYK